MSNALVKRQQTGLVPRQARRNYRIDRLAELAEQGLDASLQLHEQAAHNVVSLLVDLEQAKANSWRQLSPHKEWLLEMCVQNYLREISFAVQRTNREMATILFNASSDLDDEVVVKKLVNFFIWYIR